MHTRLLSEKVQVIGRTQSKSPYLKQNKTAYIFLHDLRERCGRIYKNLFIYITLGARIRGWENEGL